MKAQLKHGLIQTLKISFSAGLIFWLIQSGRLEFQSLSRLLHPFYVFPCLAAVGLTLAFGTERWRRFILSQGLRVKFPQAFQLTLIGTFFNFAMPGGVGGDLVKGYYITKSSSDSKMTAAMTVIMDRLIGLFAMLVLALSMMLAHWDLVGPRTELRLIFQILFLILFVFVVFWALTFSKRLHSLGYIEKILIRLPKSAFLLRTYAALTNYRHSKNTFLITFGLSLLAQMISVVFFIIAGYGLGYTQIPLSVYLFVIPIAFMVQAIPITPAGVGVGQTAAYYLFELIAPGAGAVGPAATTAYQLTQFFYGIFGAFFYLGISKKLKNS